MIIIVGVGRAGTHLLADIIKADSNYTVDIEAQPQFNYSVNAVVWGRHLLDLINIYRLKHKPNYVTKDYPCLWLYDALTATIPEVKFVAVTRNPYATIASALLHKGVMSWVTEAAMYPPNPLSGTLSPKYRPNMTAVELLALRWLEHQLEIERIAKNKNVLVLSYNTLCRDQNLTKLKLKTFMGVTPTQYPEIKPNRNKWEKQLTPNQIKQINALIGDYSERY